MTKGPGASRACVRSRCGEFVVSRLEGRRFDDGRSFGRFLTRFFAPCYREELLWAQCCYWAAEFAYGGLLGAGQLLGGAFSAYGPDETGNSWRAAA